MTLQEFLDKCESAFGGKPYDIGQRAAFEIKCARFDDRQLSRIYFDLLETCRYLPKIVDVYDSARSMGMLDAPSLPPIHHWSPTDCPDCAGEGRVAAFWKSKIEERGTGIVEVQMLQRLRPYTPALQEKIPDGEYKSLFRCKCDAGNAKTLPKAWPRIERQFNPIREIWI